jgi:dephospho-CoA kinase
MIVIGVTGGICSGKSTISRILSSTFGVPVIDADIIGHEAYFPHTTCYDQLIQNFGNTIVNEDETINRRELGKIVFSNQNKMNELQAIVWPVIRFVISKYYSLPLHLFELCSL